ncbi:MAG: metallophosphoesterase family protein [Anaerolineae bacterium]
MRLAVLADIHGNLPALEAVLADADQQGVRDGFIVAGDHVAGPPFPAETLALLRSLPTASMIAGNRDGYIVRMHRRQAPAHWWSGESAGLIRWGYHQLDAEACEYLEALPRELVLRFDGTAAIRVLHGSPEGVSGKLYPERDAAVIERMRRALLCDVDPVPPLDEQLAGVAEPVLICGHTHHQWQQEWRGGLALNPGSVGEPLSGDGRAQYALLTWDGHLWQAEHRLVAYDVERVRRRFHESGALAEGGCFARACLRNVETGRNFCGHLVERVDEAARERGLPADGVIPDAIWQDVAAAFDWENGA